MSIPTSQIQSQSSSSGGHDIKPKIEINGPAFIPPGSNIEEDEEQLEIAPTKDASKVWALKVPRFLFERWERVNQEGIHLATLVVDNSVQPPRLSLRLPPSEESEFDSNPGTAIASPNTASNSVSGSGVAKVEGIDVKPQAGPSTAKRAKYDTRGIPDEYEVAMPGDRARNTFVFTEHYRVKNGSGSGRGNGNGIEDKIGQSGGFRRRREKAHPRLLAAVDHEGSIRPIQSEKYKRILEQRRIESEQSKRPIVHLDDTKMSRARQNQLASGYANVSSTFGKNMLSAPKPVSVGERFERMDKHQLTDRLFSLFSEKPYWSITALRATLRQPDMWLREVLKDVAVLVREGTYAHMWELKEEWKDGKAGIPSTSRVKGEGEDGEEDEGDGEDDEDGDLGDDDEFGDDDDLEEVVV